jgi:3'-phosphoadenosine 5'-phosphosulfate sulfotransferase (PAPS reductase)/FAD synthetase
VNGLAGTKTDIDGYFARYALPWHPLEADGYFSIGCMSCTSRVKAGEDARALAGQRQSGMRDSFAGRTGVRGDHRRLKLVASETNPPTHGKRCTALS